MRRMAITVVTLALALSSCDRHAREFANSARAMLDDYAARIDRQIQIESQYYQRDAVIEMRHHRENLVNGMKADRAESGSDLAVELDAGSKSPLQIRSYLREYAQSEYTRRRDAYNGEVDATRVYLAKLQLLQANKDRIQAVGKLLDGLSQRLSMTAEVNTVSQAVGGAKTDFDTLICDDIATRLRTAMGKDRDSLTKLQMDRKCSIRRN
jgi:hypothetical protein